MQVLVRTGSLGAAQALQWVRWGATAGDRHIVQAAIELAQFAGNTLVADADRPEFGRFVREVFGPRARSLGFLPRANESDDDQLLRRAPCCALSHPRTPCSPRRRAGSRLRG